MNRKIVQHGSSSLTITLPIKWAEKFHIKKGDEINVEESGNSLVISTNKEQSNVKKIIKKEDGKFTKNNLSHLYQLGYDEIEIEISDDKTLKEINERLPNCIGYEIIDQKNNKIYIKSIVTTLESEFDNMLRKSFLVTDEMIKELINLLEKKEFKKINDVRNLENLNNKFTDICIRILNKKGYKIQSRTFQIYEIIKNTERLADEFKYICDSLDKVNKDKFDKSIILDIKLIHGYFKLFQELFNSDKPELKEKMILLRNEIKNKLSLKIQKSNSVNTLILYHLLCANEKIYECFGSYSALKL